MQKNPHQLIEGMIIGAYAAGANRAFIFIRGEYAYAGRHPRRRRRRGAGRRLPGRAHPRLRPLAVAGRAPRRGRLHLRRGDRAARRAGGQARQPAAQAAVPGQPGPLPGPDADQQRRDAVDRPPHHPRWAATEYAKIGVRTRRAPRSSRSRAVSSARATTRSSSASRSRDIIYGLAGGPPEGREVKLWFPGGSSSPGADRGRPRPRLRLRHDGQGGLDARLGLDHRRRRLDPRRRRRQEGREVLQARVLREVHAVPRGHELDGEDARAHRQRRGDADGPRHPRLRPGPDHRQLPVRAGDSMAMPIGSMVKQVPRRVRGAHRGRARSRPAHDGCRPASARGRQRRLRRPLPRPRWSSADRCRARSSRTVTLHDRRPRGAGARERDARRRRQVRRRRDPGLLLRAQARRSRSARAACAWSRSRASPSSRPACSTPVKDGMVVHTQTERVREAQQAVVEFLLVNHPLDCPVCDKGGECPLQDITFGWGGGTSRFIEPKRHFRKPLELSPLIAIDRERCILCYRCVRFSQEVSEDYQLVLLERGAHSFVGTFDGHPYVGALQRQHHRAVPGGRADLAPLPLPRATVGHRGRGLGVHAVPRAVQRDLHRPRRARPARARARQPRGRRRLAVRQGPLRLPVHPRRRAHHRAAAARRRRAAPGLLGARAGGRRGALSRARRRGRRARGRRRPPTRRASCSSACCARGSTPATSTGAPGATLPLELERALAAPALQATRDRPRVRPRRARARLRAGRRHADPRPADAQGRAPPPRAARGRDLAARARWTRTRALSLRYRARRRRGVPRRARCGAATRATPTGGRRRAGVGDMRARQLRRPRGAGRVRRARRTRLRATRRRARGRVLYGERLLAGRRGAAAARALLNIAAA